jgi:polysaccharide biosynthesis/export protein
MTRLFHLLPLVAALVLGASTATYAQPEQPSAAPPAAGASTAAPPPVPALNAPLDSSYILGEGDAIAISLIGRNDLNARVRVSTDGTILLPFIGRIKASGRTVLELSEDIRQALIKGGFFSDAVVQAEVVGITSRYATILGAVTSPGLLPLDRNYHLSEILAKVGGRGGGSGADYVVLTRAAGGESQRFNIDDLATAPPDKDPIVQPGDKIFIPAADKEVFYISGEVRNGGTFPITSNMTFRTAIARAGGVTENGNESKITVMRGDKPVKGIKLEDKVQVGDVIKIGERLF